MAVNKPNVHQMSSIARPYKIYPYWDFWSENIPSGSPEKESLCYAKKNYYLFSKTRLLTYIGPAISQGCVICAPECSDFSHQEPASGFLCYVQ
jgi:hypothetical protein